MLLDILILAPYLALAASVIVSGAIATMCFQMGRTPEPAGFGQRDRRAVPRYQGATRTYRPTTPVQEAA